MKEGVIDVLVWFLKDCLLFALNGISEKRKFFETFLAYIVFFRVYFISKQKGW